ncbi:MAG: hypothetical protein NZM10_01290, partial [Fimbriimonadales bacterium]|nr:hypothetical protein [Fimbriimonadales bacterium]
ALCGRRPSAPQRVERARVGGGAAVVGAHPCVRPAGLGQTTGVCPYSRRRDADATGGTGETPCHACATPDGMGAVVPSRYPE